MCGSRLDGRCNMEQVKAAASQIGRVFCGESLGKKEDLAEVVLARSQDARFDV